MIIGHPGTWQHFQSRSDNRNLSVMEMKSKYLHEQYLFEAQMLNLQQLHQQNAFMNGGGGGPLPSSSEPTYSTALQLTFNDTLANMTVNYGYDVTSTSAWNSSGKFLNGSNPSDFGTVVIVDNYTIILKGNEESLTIAASVFDGDSYLTNITDVNDNCITTIGEAAFNLATALITATLNAVTTINLTAFWGCASLTTVSFNSLVNIPNAVGQENGVFANCDLSGLADFDVGFPSLQSAGGFSFYHTSLNNIRSQVLTNIGIQAFANSSTITGIDISTPSNITIRSRAFNICTSLINISIVPKVSWTAVTDQFLGISLTGNGAFNSGDLTEGSVTYLTTLPYTWTITSF